MGMQQAMGSGEKASNFSKSWGMLIKYCRSYLPAIVIALIIASVGTAFQVIGPDKVRAITDEIVKGIPLLIDGEWTIINQVDLSAVTSIALFLVGLYVVAAILSFIENFMMATISARISK
ncbi:MAG: ABC transporter ATP-binding protein, partial [Dehalococcoidia bacterium]|nr:ABC transporter ATP-binding protein [Dehalococcoidia bacterium]